MTFRITDSYLSSIFVGDLNRSLGSVLKQQRMASTLRRVNSFADDPRSVGLIQRYNSLIANNDGYRKNVDRSRVLVDSTDTALQNVSNVLADARVIALREASALGTPDSMRTTVTEVDHMVDRLLEVLNTSVEGNFIFAGRSAGNLPFTKSGGRVSYAGDDLETFSRTGPNSTMAVNIPGDVFMGSQSSTLTGGTDMAPRLTGPVLLNDINLNKGWDTGSLVIEDGANNSFNIDLTGASTLEDILNMVGAQT
ncbi:MAG: flagellin-like hook-associated protein FlgL, partial [Candidatus Krumholzibacteriia bacterium]